MNLFGLSGLINGVTSSVLGVFVLMRNPKDPRYFSFSIFSLTVAIWSYFYYFWENSTQPGAALFWNRMLMAGAIFIPVAHLHYVSILTREKSCEKLIRWGYAVGTIFLFLDFTPYFISGVSPKLHVKYWAIPGPLFHPFLVIWMAYLLYGIFLIYKNFRMETGAQRNRLTYVLLATLVGFGGGTTNYFAWYNILIPPYGNILVSVYVMIIAYAILKHHLMDIEVVIRKTAIYSILTALLTGILLSFVFVGEMLFRGFIGYNSIWAAIFAIFIIAIIFQPLQNKIHAVIDQIFSKSKYDYRGTLKNLSQTSSSIINLDKLLKLISITISKSLRPNKVSIYLWDKDKDCFRFKPL